MVQEKLEMENKVHIYENEVQNTPANEELDHEGPEEFSTSEEESVPENNLPRRSKRIRKPVQRSDFVTYFSVNEQENLEPLTVEEALNGPDSQDWKIAIQSELNSLIKNSTYECVTICAWLIA